jgi:hypothetical protein
VAELARRSPDHPLRSFDVHPLDHFVAEALSPAVKGVDQRFRPLKLGFGRRERLVTGPDLARVDQALPIEAKAAAVLSLAKQSIAIVEAVEHPVEGSDSCCPGR